MSTIHPPAYVAHDVPSPVRHQTALSEHKAAVTSARSSTTAQTPSSFLSDLPCVIPQTSKSFRGAFFSPFARAYPPAISAYGISSSEFLTFIDGLNEVFVAHPLFQGLGIAGGVMTVIHGVPPVQWAGIGLQVTSGFASAGNSYLRTRAYVKAINARLFHPAGLHLNVLTTKKMMTKVGIEGETLELPPIDLSQYDAASHATPLDDARNVEQTVLEDQRNRRLQALDGHVMPLSFDVPEIVAPDSFFDKIGSKQAVHLSRKQEEKADKNRKEAHKKMSEKTREAEKEQRKCDKEVAKRQRKADKELSKLDRKVQKESDPDKKEEAIDKYKKEEKKLLKEVAKEADKRDKEVASKYKEARKEIGKVEKKESKTANKIRWLVIAKWEGEDEDGARSSSIDEDAVDAESEI